MTGAGESRSRGLQVRPEPLKLCQRGCAADPEDGWNDLSRGMADELQGQANKMDELQLRVFWRRWADVMNEACTQAA